MTAFLCILIAFCEGCFCYRLGWTDRARLFPHTHAESIVQRSRALFQAKLEGWFAGQKYARERYERKRDPITKRFLA